MEVFLLDYLVYFSIRSVEKTLPFKPSANTYQTTRFHVHENNTLYYYAVLQLAFIKIEVSFRNYISFRINGTESLRFSSIAASF
jgi:hypothetical protein